MFSQIQKSCLPIKKDILEQITQDKSQCLLDLNIDISIKVAQAGFLRMREFTYTKTEFANQKLFIVTKLISSDIIFCQDHRHVIILLKRSKTNIKEAGKEIIIEVTNNSTSSVTAF